MRKRILSIFAMLVLSAACSRTAGTQNYQPSQLSVQKSTLPIAAVGKLRAPIDSPLPRITKKPFGIYITAANSPVQPERFNGFHTGVDLEVAPAEENADVPIYAACDGKLLLKKYAIGYGGVMAQSCMLDGSAVTIIYGHIRLSSASNKIGDQLKAGDKLAVLAAGYSYDSNGERKHLHFGIHKGSAINIHGYVQTKSALSGWLDAEEYLK